MDIKFALLGFAALAEFDSFAKEINDPSVESLVRKICSQKTNVDQLRSAKSFLKQARDHLSTENVDRAVELLDKVNTKATEALNCSENKDLSDLVLSAKYPIVGGLMYAFTSSWATNSLLSDLYGKCSLWITP